MNLRIGFVKEIFLAVVTFDLLGVVLVSQSHSSQDQDLMLQSFSELFLLLNSALGVYELHFDSGPEVDVLV